jgi:hypothetical protein
MGIGQGSCGGGAAARVGGTGPGTCFPFPLLSIIPLSCGGGGGTGQGSCGGGAAAFLLLGTIISWEGGGREDVLSLCILCMYYALYHG